MGGDRESDCDTIQPFVQACMDIATGVKLPAPDRMLDPSNPCQGMVQYHNGAHYVGILGDFLARARVKGPPYHRADDIHGAIHTQEKLSQSSAHMHLFDGLDSVDRQYLTKKSAFSLPPKPHCEALLKLYFEFAFVDAPIFDRLEFMQSYESGCYSHFLAQAILANATLYASESLLTACGFTGRHEALEVLYSRATMLFDFGREKNQLRLLQGSVILGMTGFSPKSDKDFRYWLHNAIRLATRMGIHKSCDDIVYNMDPSTCKLYRRIWWVLYNRDVAMSFVGQESRRLLSDHECDITNPPNQDWADEQSSSSFASVFSPLTTQQKHYFVETCKLAVIGSWCLSTLKCEQSPSLDRIECDFETWRMALPKSLKEDYGQHSQDRLCRLVLLATSYRFECVIFRILWRRLKSTGLPSWNQAQRRLRLAMYELDILIGRALAYDMLPVLPMSFLTSIPTVLALHLELSLEPQEPMAGDLFYSMYIRQAILCMRQCQDLPTIKSALELAEWVLNQRRPIPSNGLFTPRLLSHTMEPTSGIFDGFPMGLSQNPAPSESVIGREWLDELFEPGVFESSFSAI